jgi:hypothetical protein
VDEIGPGRAGPHREENLLGLLDGALVLPSVHLRRGGPGAGEALDRRLERVERALPPAAPRRVGVGALLERAAAEAGGRVRRAGVHGEVGGGGHGAGLRDLTLALLKRRLGLVFASAPFGKFFGEEACDRQALLHLQVDKYSKGKRREFFFAE